MITKYTIKAIIRKDKIKHNQKCPVNFVIRIGMEKIKISLKIEVNPKDWNDSTSRLKRNAPNAINTNKFLDNEEQKFQNFMYKKMIAEEKVEIIDVRQFFDGYSSDCFYTFYEEVVRLLNVKQQTKVVYFTTLRILKELRPKLNFQEVNLLLVQQFHDHMIKIRKNTPEGTYNRHKNLKSVIRLAIVNDKMTRNPYHSYKMPKLKNRETFLTVDEVKAWNDLDLSTVKSSGMLSYCRDLFSFGIYTGTRFRDLLNLEKDNIVSYPSLSSEHAFSYRLEYTMRKTGKFISIPLLPQAMTLIEKYASESPNLFPYISNSHINNQFKKLAAMANIDKHITFHISRHSFACSLVDNDVPLIEVRNLMGHSSIKHTERYAKVTKEKMDRSMKKLEEAFNPSKNLNQAC